MRIFAPINVLCALRCFKIRYGFALVCGEALQDIFGHGGQWNIPEIQTDETGLRCGMDDSLDSVYLKNVVESLNNSSTIYDTSRMFTSGCSMGSAFSIFIGNCMYKWFGSSSFSAFATHSTGTI